MAVDWRRIGEPLANERNRKNLEYLALVDQYEAAQDANLRANLQQRMLLAKAEYEADFKNYQALTQFITNKHNMDMDERRLKLQQDQFALQEAEDKRSQQRLDYQQKGEERAIATEERARKRQLEDEARFDQRKKDELAVLDEEIAGYDTQIATLGTQLESQTNLDEEDPDRAGNIERIQGEIAEVKGEKAKTEQERRKTRTKAYTPPPRTTGRGASFADKVSDMEAGLGRPLTQEEKEAFAREEMGLNGASGSDWWQKPMEDALANSNLDSTEKVLLANHLLPILRTFSKRSLFTQTIITDAINEISTMEGPGRVTDYIDAYNKRGEDPDLEPVRGIARAIGTTKLGASNDELRNAVEFDLERRLAHGRATGDYTLLKEGILKHTRTFGDKEGQRITDQRRVLTQAGFRLKQMLQELEAAGVDVGLWDGTKEGLAQIVGGTTDPRYVQFQNTADIFNDLYVTTKSGASFTDAEVQKALKLFPAIRKGFALNRASIDTLIQNGVNMTLSSLANVYGSYLNDVPGTGEEWAGAIANTTIHTLDVPTDVNLLPEGVDGSRPDSGGFSDFEGAAKAETTPEQLKVMLMNNNKFRYTPAQADEIVNKYRAFLENRNQ